MGQRNCALLHAPEERHDDDAARALQRLGRDLLDDLLVALVLLALALGVRDAAGEVAVVVGLRAVAEGAEDARGLLDLALGQLGGPEALCAGAVGEPVDACESPSAHRPPAPRRQPRTLAERVEGAPDARLCLLVPLCALCGARVLAEGLDLVAESGHACVCWDAVVDARQEERMPN
jgi:hypothetical protein